MSFLGTKLLLDTVVSDEVLGCLNRGSSNSNGVIIFVFSTGENTNGTLCPFCHLQFKKEIGNLKRIQKRVMRTIKKLENIYYGQKILGLGTSIYFTKRKLKGDLFTDHKSLEG